MYTYVNVSKYNVIHMNESDQYLDCLTHSFLSISCVLYSPVASNVAR